MMPTNPKQPCDCDGNCTRCKIARGDTADFSKSDLEDAVRLTCMVCECKLTIPGGYYGTGMCGPCCTGEAQTLSEKGTHW